jgi:hypothetical protein
VTICTPWRVGNSLNKLLDQANRHAPNRSKASDGSIGDAAHQAEACSSQHNSCCVKYLGVWIVRARDFTHDPAHGFDSFDFAERLRVGRDPRIRYVISNRRITGPNYGWTWHAYNGDDPHTNHAHVSVWDDAARFDNTADWALWETEMAKPGPPSEADFMIYTITDAGAKGQVLFHDIHGAPVEHTSRCLATPNGPVAYDYAEIIEWFAATPHATVNVTWARLQQICEDLKPPVQASPLDVAAVADAILARALEKLGAAS